MIRSLNWIYLICILFITCMLGILWPYRTQPSWHRQIVHGKPICAWFQGEAIRNNPTEFNDAIDKLRSQVWDYLDQELSLTDSLWYRSKITIHRMYHQSRRFFQRSMKLSTLPVQMYKELQLEVLSIMVRYSLDRWMPLGKLKRQINQEKQFNRPSNISDKNSYSGRNEKTCLNSYCSTWNY